MKSRTQHANSTHPCCPYCRLSPLLSEWRRAPCRTPAEASWPAGGRLLCLILHWQPREREGWDGLTCVCVCVCVCVWGGGGGGGINYVYAKMFIH